MKLSLIGCVLTLAVVVLACDEEPQVAPADTSAGAEAELAPDAEPEVGEPDVLSLIHI